MNVGELIERLQRLPSGMEVRLTDEDGTVVGVVNVREVGFEVHIEADEPFEQGFDPLGYDEVDDSSGEPE